jgi:hypothetical protein
MRHLSPGQNLAHTIRKLTSPLIQFRLKHLFLGEHVGQNRISRGQNQRVTGIDPAMKEFSAGDELHSLGRRAKGRDWKSSSECFGKNGDVRGDTIEFLRASCRTRP